jgi:hydrogenase nickel incorporation protein HypA/HybF
MHELAIAQGIVNILNEQMKIHNLVTIQSVELRVGVLRGVEIASLNFGFSALTAGSPLEGARLNVSEVPIQGRCVQCGRHITLKSWLDDCPLCSGSRVEIVSGKELEIVAIEGE